MIIIMLTTVSRFMWSYLWHDVRLGKRGEPALQPGRRRLHVIVNGNEVITSLVSTFS